MLDEDVENICKKDDHIKQSFKKVLAKDDVRIQMSLNESALETLYEEQPFLFPASFVLNTGTYKQRGRHWQAVYFDIDGNCFYFDSYGHKPEEDYIRFCEKINSLRNRNANRIRFKLHYMTREIQAYNTSVCGEYCIYFLYQMNTLKYPIYISKIMEMEFPPPDKSSEKRDQCDNYRQFYINDEFVREWVQRKYNYDKIKNII